MLRVLIDSFRRRRDWRSLGSETRERYSRDRAGQLNDDPGIDASVQAAIVWLVLAQEKSPSNDGGVARHFSIVDGWGPSYPETTGYIIPTMLEHARVAGNDQWLSAARRMLDWIVRIQLDNGAFQGGTVNDTPVVGVTFNTGQILMGLAAGSKSFGEPFTASMHLAANWLVDCMDADGCWRKNQSPFARAGEKTYETHTAWGLLEAARASGVSSFSDAALKNIRWALSKQQDNGWFSDCCLTDPRFPLTHTLGYAFRGIIEGYLFSRDARLLDAAERTAIGLLPAIRSDGALPGRLDKSWRGAVEWVCLTGSVQIAHCLLLLYVETGKKDYLSAARNLNRYVRRTVDLDRDVDTHGAIRGSFPIYGEYGQFQYLNWAAKFFVDSNVLEKRIVEADE